MCADLYFIGLGGRGRFVVKIVTRATVACRTPHALLYQITQGLHTNATPGANAPPTHLIPLRHQRHFECHSSTTTTSDVPAASALVMPRLHEHCNTIATSLPDKHF